MVTYVDTIVNALNDGKECSYVSLYKDWMEKTETLLGHRLDSQCVPLKKFLCKCLEFGLSNRPPVTDLSDRWVAAEI